MDHFISLDKAVEMVRLYREKREEILKVEYAGQDTLVYSETFDRAAFDTLLTQPDCTGLRIYYGMDEEFKVHAITVGVNEKNEDLLPSTTEGANSGFATQALLGGSIVEAGTRCPTDCPPLSPLNP